MNSERLKFADVLNAYAEPCDERAALIVDLAKLIDSSKLKWNESRRAWVVNQVSDAMDRLYKDSIRFRISLERTKL